MTQLADVIDGEVRRIGSGGPLQASIGFSLATVAGRSVSISGCATETPEGDGDEAYLQASACLDEIARRLAHAGASVTSVYRTRMYIIDAADAAAVGRAHAEMFGDHRPASTMVVVAALLDPVWRVEIEAEALLPEQPVNGS